MSNFRDDLCSLAHDLEEERDRAHDLWTWLPSYAAAQRKHEDYAGEHFPGVESVLVEASEVLAHHAGRQEDLSAWQKCPCGCEDFPEDGDESTIPSPDVATEDRG